MDGPTLRRVSFGCLLPFRGPFLRCIVLVRIVAAALIALARHCGLLLVVEVEGSRTVPNGVRR
jgi:hypothetical protein